MADMKKGNPLSGAFRAPAPGMPPGGEKKPDEPPTLTTTPSKPGEDKKPVEPPKDTVPTKPVEDKKPVEPPKDAAAPGKPGEDKKTPEPPKDATAPTKPGEDKKPSEPPKDAAAPGKPGEDKKTPEPPKDAAAPGKPGEDKKPVEPPKDAAPGKSAEDKKPAEPPKDVAPPGKPPEDKKPPEPPKDTAPIPEETELPKNLHIPLAPTEGGEIVTRLKLDEVHAFEGHPYSVKDDKDMWDLVESVKQFGVLEPAMVIPREAGGYELVSGHRRHRAAQLAGLTQIPVIIRTLDRDEAIISMVDANLKRENISPMEKARAYDMKLSAMQRKTGRRSKMEVLTGEKPKTAVEELAEQTGESVASIKKIRNLVNLTPELQTMVEEKKLPVFTAADIAQLKPAEQKQLADAIEKEGGKVPSGTQAAALKEASKAGTLTSEKINNVVAPTRKETNPELKVTFTNDELRSYFPDTHTTVGDVKRIVFEALTLRNRAIEKQAKQEAAQKAPLPKTHQMQR